MNNSVKLVPEIIEKIRVLPFNTETTIAELVNYNPEENFVEPLSQGQIFNEIKKNCMKENICIERNRDELGGLAFYYKFKKVESINNEFKINSNISFEDEINEYNRKIANGEKPEKELSEIMNKFKVKFNIDGAETACVESKNLDELIEKSNKSLDSNYTNTNLSIDEQIYNIDKRIEELNKLEDNDI